MSYEGSNKGFLNPKNAWKGILAIVLVVVASILTGLGISEISKTNVKPHNHVPASSTSAAYNFSVEPSSIVIDLYVKLSLLYGRINIWTSLPQLP